MKELYVRLTSERIKLLEDTIIAYESAIHSEYCSWPMRTGQCTCGESADAIRAMLAEAREQSK